MSEKEFMEENFPDVVKISMYEKTLSDTVQLFARSVINTHGERQCVGLNTKALEETPLMFCTYVPDSKSQFSTILWYFYGIIIIWAILLGVMCAILNQTAKISNQNKVIILFVALALSFACVMLVLIYGLASD